MECDSGVWCSAAIVEATGDFCLQDSLLCYDELKVVSFLTLSRNESTFLVDSPSCL